MKNSLIPEKPILVYPSLAATLGLDESVMLAVLSDLSGCVHGTLNNNFVWYAIPTASLMENLAFWDERDLIRVANSLRDKGILLMTHAPNSQAPTYKFAFNEKRMSRRATPAQTCTQPPPAIRAQHTAAPASAPPLRGANHTPAFTTNSQKGISGGENYIANNWQPDGDTLTQLAQHNIPAEFALELVPEFITYWRERGEKRRSWGAKFLSHVIHKWRNFESTQQQRHSETPMHPHWRPSLDAVEILTQQAEISQTFVEDAIPEFILYWQERGDKTNTWNSKFIQHIRLQWKFFNSTVEHSKDPKPISAQWRPSEDVYDVLRLANIDLRFAEDLIPEFIMYWRDSGQVHTSWNTRYLQYVKKRWAYQLNHPTASTRETTDTTRELNLEKELTDRSWAN